MKDKTMKETRIKRFNENSELNISDVMCSFIKENLSIGLSIEGTSVTVKMFLKDEVISEFTDCLTIYKRDVEDLD
jgi:hypothetical protein